MCHESHDKQIFTIKHSGHQNTVTQELHGLWHTFYCIEIPGLFPGYTVFHRTVQLYTLDQESIIIITIKSMQCYINLRFEIFMMTKKLKVYCHEVCVKLTRFKLDSDHFCL